MKEFRGNSVGSREVDGFEDEVVGPLGREADAEAVGKDVASIGPGPTLGLNSLRKAMLNCTVSPNSSCTTPKTTNQSLTWRQSSAYPFQQYHPFSNQISPTPQTASKTEEYKRGLGESRSRSTDSQYSPILSERSGYWSTAQRILG